MPRARTWDTNELHSFLLERANVPFQYGVQDCALLACDAIAAMTGVDIAQEFRGYKTQRGALRAIRKVTGGSTVEHAAVYCATKYGLTEYPHPLKAQRGDLVLIEQADGLLLGLIDLSGTCVLAPGDDGIRRLELTSIKRSWRI
jgi:hypothetical protein